MITAPDFSHPFSAFTHSTNNPASFIIGQHYEAVDQAIEELWEMHQEGINIDDPDIFYSVLDKHSLDDDGFELEEEAIVQELNRRIRCL